ncbi:MAG: 3-isopropylmalate dehydrogenase [Holophaga sp.]|jgi:3-isopropylmalate dehydrogenase
MKARIAVLPGDGIGPEVTREAVACLGQVARAFGHQFSFRSHPVGGYALDAFGEPLPAATLQACLESDAVLLGAVGDPRYDARPAGSRPETGLLALRRALGAYANLRPARLHPALARSSPLREEVVRGTDLVIVRELAGGLYFGEPRSLEPERGVNTLVYTRPEVERIARVAFDLARQRRCKVTSVDKANVLESSQLWRRVVTEVARDYPDVALSHLYVDACAMALVTRPASFDVVLTDNLFGDILSDEAAVLGGSLGMLPSASLGGKVGLYEPVHGSAPDLAGRDLANPVGAIASAALLLRHSLGLEAEAAALEAAVATTLAQGFGTADLSCQPARVGTRGLGEAVRQNFAREAGQPAPDQTEAFHGGVSA